jgi:tetratricopeptide (TPR) repeat protein
MNYYNKAIYLDSIKNNQLYQSRTPMDAMQDMNTNYEYYYDRAIIEMNFAEYSSALADYEKSIQIHPTIEAYKYAAYLAKKIGQNQKACNYIQMWATTINPSEQIEPFKKHEIAESFCKDLQIQQK